MDDGEVLARGSASNKPLTGSGKNRSRAGYALIGSVISAIACIALVTALFWGQDGHIEDGRAGLAILAVLGIFVSVLTSVVVAVYLIVRKVRAVAQPEGPQDARDSAVLHSMSLSNLIGLTFAWICFMIIGGVIYGGAGFLGAAVVGLGLSIAVITHYGVLDQYIEVTPGQVEIRTLGYKRTFPSALVTDVAFDPSTPFNSVQPHLCLNIEGEKPMYFGGRFVSNHDRAEGFVSDARQILGLDTPQDGPAPPRPQDALR